MPPSLHSELGASSASRWMKCPASVRMARLVSEKRKSSSFYANEGSVAHSVCEKLISGEATIEEMRGEIVNYGGDLIEIDNEMLESAQIYVDAIKKVSCLELHQIKVEQRFKLDWLYPGMFGTCDAWCINGETLYIFDFKYGKGHAVKAERNPQLMYYALGILGRLGSNESVKEVCMTIVQPRVNVLVYRTSYVIPVWELYEWGYTELLPAAIETTKEDAPCVPGEEQCRWCSGSSVCPAMYDKTMQLAGEFFPMDKVTNEPMVDVKAVALPAPAELSARQLRIAMDIKTVIVPYLEKVAENATERMKNGLALEGYKLKEKRTLERWIDGAEEHLVQLLGDKCYSKKLISPAAAKKLVDSSQISEYITKPKGELEITPEKTK